MYFVGEVVCACSSNVVANWLVTFVLRVVSKAVGRPPHLWLFFSHPVFCLCCGPCLFGLLAFCMFLLPLALCYLMQFAGCMCWVREHAVVFSTWSSVKVQAHCSLQQAPFHLQATRFCRVWAAVLLFASRVLLCLHQARV